MVIARHICHAPLTMGTFPVSAGAAVITPQRRLRRHKLYILCFCTGAKAQSCRCSGFSQRIGDSLGSQNKRRRVPPKSLGGREEVSLSPHAVTAPEMPLSGFRLALIARNSPVYHLLGLSIFAARLIRSYMGYVPEMPSIQLSSCMREIDPLTYFPVGKVV